MCWRDFEDHSASEHGQGLEHRTLGVFTRLGDLPCFRHHAWGTKIPALVSKEIEHGSPDFTFSVNPITCSRPECLCCFLYCYSTENVSRGLPSPEVCNPGTHENAPVLTSPQKLKHRITRWPSNSTSGYKPRRVESRGKNRYLSTRVHSSKKVETTQVSIDGWTVQWNISLKKEGNPVLRHNVDEPWGHRVECDMPERKGQLCDSSYMRDLELANS